MYVEVFYLTTHSTHFIEGFLFNDALNTFYLRLYGVDYACTFACMYACIHACMDGLRYILINNYNCSLRIMYVDLLHYSDHYCMLEARCSSVGERPLVVQWVLGSCHFSFQPLLHDWYNKGRGMCYPDCDDAYKRCHAASRRVAHVAAAGFLSRYLSGPLPYVQPQITIIKM